MSWSRLSTEVIHQNPWWTFCHDRYKMPSGAEGDYFYVDKKYSVMMVPIRVDGLVVMVRQYRYLQEKWSIEFPGGGVRQCVALEESARIELGEETGYAAEELIAVGEFAPYNGISNEMCRVYLARSLSDGVPHPDTTEETLETIARRPDEIEMMISRNEIWDGMTISAWALVRERI